MNVIMTILKKTHEKNPLAIPVFVFFIIFVLFGFYFSFQLYVRPYKLRDRVFSEETFRLLVDSNIPNGTLSINRKGWYELTPEQSYTVLSVMRPMKHLPDVTLNQEEMTY